MQSESIEYLKKLTEEWRSYFQNADNVFSPDPDHKDIPPSIFQYNPVIWEEDNMWFTLFGRFPDVGVSTLGTTPLESMQAFDKELKERLSGDGKLINEIDEARRQEIHKVVFAKIDRMLDELLKNRHVHAA